MFENYKILLLESNFRDKNIVMKYNYQDRLEYILFPKPKLIGRGALGSVDNFIFSMTDIREYFSNFSFIINEFKENNRIVPVHDFDLIIEINVRSFVTNFLHDHNFGGFVLNYITFKISEITLDDKDNSITHRILHEFELFGVNYLKKITKRLHLKAGKQYEISFLDDIRQRIIDNVHERYGIDIDFTLRFYYTTDKDRYFDEEYSWSYIRN